MLSKTDIKKLLEVFATKQDLVQLREKVATKAQYNNLIDKLDAVYGQLKDFRQGTVSCLIISSNQLKVI